MSPSTSKPKAKPLRILCFGDSLTEGYSCFGTVMTPYSETLLTELTNKILAGDINRKLEIVTDGMSGDLVTVGGFRDRMTKNCALCSFQTLD
jgi:lysophospholipase L1-like esterase